MELIYKIINQLSEFLTAGALATFGGAAAYLHQSLKNGEKFKWTSFLVNAILAFFVGNLVGSFIPLSFDYRDGCLLLAGFSAHPILSLLEIKGKDWIVGWIERAIGAGPTQASAKQEIILDPNKTPTYAPDKHDGAPANRFDDKG